MKKIIGLVLVGITCSSSIIVANQSRATAQKIAQADPNLQIVCGAASDAMSRGQEMPATVAKVPGADPVVLIIWKSEAFKNFSPQQRCEIVSPKIQAAVRAGRTVIKPGVDPVHNIGIVCAVADRNDRCNAANMLFTLKNYATANNAIKDLSIEGNGGNPEYESAKIYTLDLNKLLKRH